MHPHCTVSHCFHLQMSHFLWKHIGDFIQMRMQSSLLHLHLHVTTLISGQHENGKAIGQSSHQGGSSVMMSLLSTVIAYSALGIQSNCTSSCITKCDQFYDNLIISLSKTWNYCKTGTWTVVKLKIQMKLNSSVTKAAMSVEVTDNKKG